MAEYKPFVGFTSEPKEMAALSQPLDGLPIGPTLPLVSLHRETGTEFQKKKDEEKKSTESEAKA